MATGPLAGSFVDKIEPFLRQAGEGFREIGDAVGDVMEALAPFLKEAPNRRIMAQGFNQFDGPSEEDSDTLIRELLDRGTGVSGHEFEQGDRPLEGSDGYGDVVKRIRKHVFFGAWVRAVGAPEGS